MSYYLSGPEDSYQQTQQETVVTSQPAQGAAVVSRYTGYTPGYFTQPYQPFDPSIKSILVENVSILNPLIRKSVYSVTGSAKDSEPLFKKGTPIAGTTIQYTEAGSKRREIPVNSG